MGGLVHTKTEIYDDPQLGVKLRYESLDDAQLIKADTYLYDLGLQTIPDDIVSPEVEEFFQQSCSEIIAASEHDIYLDLQMLSSQFLHIPDDAPVPTFHCASFYYRQPLSAISSYDGFRYSHLALRTDRNYINKVRFTYPDYMADEGGDQFVEFLFDWIKEIHNAKT